MIGAEILALLGTLGTGIAGTAIWEGMKNARELLPVTSERRKAIEKKWSGVFTQHLADNTDDTVEISLILRVKRKSIVGVGECIDGRAEFELAGGFYRDDYLHLNYVNRDKAIFQRGLVILHWPNDPVTLKGKFVGIGKDSNIIVSGEIELKA